MIKLLGKTLTLLRFPFNLLRGTRAPVPSNITGLICHATEAIPSEYAAKIPVNYMIFHLTCTNPLILRPGFFFSSPKIFSLLLLDSSFPSLGKFSHTHTLISSQMKTQQRPSLDLQNSPSVHFSLLWYSSLKLQLLWLSQASNSVSSIQKHHWAPSGLSLSLLQPENFLRAISWGNQWDHLVFLLSVIIDWSAWCPISENCCFIDFVCSGLLKSWLRQEGKFSSY